ncbi:MAG: M90 family metallopeptidase [bacterium]|nr:M90 family metallopeptidase [bacterium]
MRAIAGADIFLHAACAALVAFAIVVLATEALHAAWALLAVPAVALYAAAALHRPLRRRRLARRPFPAAWRDILSRDVSFYRRLDGEGRRRFERDVRIFLSEWTIEGVGGAAADDEARVLIAAAAAVLVHGRPDWELPRGRTVLVYPEGFDERFRFRPSGPLIGEVHGQGPVIISRRGLLDGWRGAGGAVNVAIHEFAHLLDMRAARADGVPAMLQLRSVGPWLDLMEREMERVRRGRSILDPYAAENEAEFFAVAVETFFARPRAMRDRHPELYGALARLFNQDPASSAGGKRGAT